MVKPSNSTKFSPGTKLKSSEDDFIIREGHDNKIRLSIYTGEKKVFKTFEDAFNFVVEYQERGVDGLGKVKVQFQDGHSVVFNLAEAAKKGEEYKKIMALDSNKSTNNVNVAKKQAIGWLIEEYSLGDKWHPAQLDANNEPYVYETKKEALAELKSMLADWENNELDYDPDEYRVVKYDPSINEVKPGTTWVVG